MQEQNSSIPNNPGPSPQTTGTQVVKPIEPHKNHGLYRMLLTVLVVILIGITAFVSYQNYLLTQKVSKLSQTPTPASSGLTPNMPDDTRNTANWQTYTNSKYYFSIKYPQTWDIESADQNPNTVVAIMPPGTQNNATFTDFRIEIYSENDTSITSQANTTTFSQELSSPVATDTNQRNYKIGNVKIGNLDAVQYIQQTLPGDPTEPSYSIVTWLNKDGANYYFRLGIVKSDVITLSSTYNQILSTFQFTNSNSVDTSTWQTYTNTQDKFSLKYPAAWNQTGPLASNDVAYLHSDESIGTGPEPLRYYVWITSTNTLPNVQLTKKSLGIYTEYETDKLPSRLGALNEFITNNGKDYISISLAPYDLQKPFTSQDKYVAIFNQILSTFQFTQ